MREKLVHFRGKRSQHKMAELYSVSQQAWSKWEKGITCPSPAIMLLLERDSGIPMEELFFDAFQQHSVVENTDNIRIKREAAGLNIEDMMAILGMTKTEYEALENGTVSLTPEIEEILNATI